MLPPDIETGDALRHLSAPADTSRSGISRRRFLQAAALAGGGLMAGPGLGSLGGLIPGFEEHLAAASPLGPTDGVLVVVTLAGGNDALNTVVPYGQSAYYDKRGPLALPAAQTLGLAPGVGLHPNLSKLKARYNAGKVAVVQGVGVLEQSTFSHFDSMRYWMNGWGSASPPSTGWLGRWLDGLATTNPFAAVSIGSAVPLHLVGATRKALSLSTSGPPFGGVPDPSWDLLYKAIGDFAAAPTGLGTWGDTVAANGQELISTSAQANKLYGAWPFPPAPLTAQFNLAARLVNLNIGVRVIGITQGNFDSHSNQPSMHPYRMAELDAAIEEFFTKVNSFYVGRTAMLVYSEFGRYPVRNDSNGFDHGWSGNAFVIGDRVAGGLLGTTLDVANTLPSGHIQPTVDFRSMYGGIVDQWLAGDHTSLLGTSATPLTLFSSGPH